MRSLSELGHTAPRATPVSASVSAVNSEFEVAIARAAMYARGVQTLPADIGWYLSGLTDGEGCFTIERSKQKRKWTYRCAFYIKLRDDDIRLLQWLQRSTGLGTIRRQNRTDGSKPSATWAVYRKAEVMQLARIFDEFPLRSKKRRDWMTWCRAVEFWADVSYGVDWAPMEEHYHAIKYVREYRKLREAA